MASRFVVGGVLGLACVLAAGGGAYLAVTQGDDARAAQVANQTPAIAAHVPEQPGPERSVTVPPASTEVPPVATTAPPAAADADVAKIERPEARTTKPARRDRAARPSQPDDATAPSAGDRGGTGVEPVLPTEPVSLPPVVQPQAPPAQPPAEPQREFVEVTVPAESVLGLELQTAVSSETAKVEDRVEARVSRDVRVNDRVAIPSGSQVIGSVVQVERGGKVRERAHLAIRFHTLFLPDGTRVTLTSEALYREGPSPASKSAAKIGGAAVGGAILGAILGGGKGAAIGGSVGAAGGTAATMAGGRQPALLAAGSMVNVRLMSPLTLTLER